MSYALRMSDEIRDWLADLCEGEPVAALRVGAALAALISEGPSLAAPLVVALDAPQPSPRPAGQPETPDPSHQERLEQMQAVRRHHAEAAGLLKDIERQVAELEARQAQLGEQRWQALQEGRPEAAAQAVDELAKVQGQLAELRRLLPRVSEAERRLYLKHQRQHQRVAAFQARQEALQATQAAAEAVSEIRETLARLGADLGAADEDAQPPDDDPGAGIEERVAQIERELRPPVSAEGLMELRPGAPGHSDIRLLFAVEPPGTALLIAVLEGRDVVDEQRGEAVELSAEVLRRVRAGQAPEAAAQAFDDVPSFLDEFFPGSATDVEAAAAALAGRNRASTLAAARARLDLTPEDVARRMGVRPARIAAIERAEPGATEVRTLAAYVEALGGRLEIIAYFGDERVTLR